MSTVTYRSTTEKLTLNRDIPNRIYFTGRIERLEFKLFYKIYNTIYPIVGDIRGNSYLVSITHWTDPATEVQNYQEVDLIVVPSAPRSI